MVGAREEPTSNEMRHDWLADRWVIIAPQRTTRPTDFVTTPAAIVDKGDCPFCCGHEERTPAAVASYRSSRASNAGHWCVRVVPNKFPAVGVMWNGVPLASPPTSSQTQDSGNTHTRGVGHDEGRGEEHGGPQAGEPGRPSTASECHQPFDLFRRRGLCGGHEVIVESPQHFQSISQLDRETTQLVFTAYRDRLHHWLHERGLAYAVVFKNVGQDAGASLAHTHSQLIATDILPTDVQRSIRRMQLYREREATCLFCRMAEDELEQQVRLVEQTPEFVAFCPFASRLPSMVTILPKRHQSRFDVLDQSQLEQLSWLTHRLVRRIERCYPEAAYNFIIHTAPSCQSGSDSFHWRLELFPRLTKVAGFEWGSDCYINPIAPENAAAALRLARL
ncbi:MAG: DUF4921 family protein [Planctomycetales bacterium]|nr:DUF4921 family protein [Planctomycetales bacterium]